MKAMDGLVATRLMSVHKPHLGLSTRQGGLLPSSRFTYTHYFRAKSTCPLVLRIQNAPPPLKVSLFWPRLVSCFVYGVLLYPHGDYIGFSVQFLTEHTPVLAKFDLFLCRLEFLTPPR